MKLLQKLEFDHISPHKAIEFSDKIIAILDVFDIHAGAATNFKAASNNYKTVMGMVSVAGTSEEIAEADNLADDEWRALDLQISASLTQNHNAKQRDAADRVFSVFSKIEDPTDLPYKEEYAQLAFLLESLDKLPKAVLEDAHVIENIKGLKQRVKEFNALYSDKIKTSNEAEITLLRQTRINLDNAWKKLAIHMDAEYTVHSEDGSLKECMIKLYSLF